MTKLKNNRVFRLCFFSLIFALILLLLFILYKTTGLGFKCVFYELTGFKCAGCGFTHALEALINFKFIESLSFNYMYPVFLFYFLWVYIFSAKEYLKGKSFNYTPPFKALDISLLALVIVWTILRNVLNV